jgi:hypothetical protein
MNNATSTAYPDRPVRRRYWLPWLLAILTILAVLGGATYQQRTSLLTRSANALLQPYGLQIESLHALRMNTSSLRIRQLVLRRIDSGAQQTLRGIVIDYDASGLLRGQVESISIDSADINLPAPEALTADPAAPAIAGGVERPTPAAQPPLADRLASIPFASLSIDALQITVEALTTGPIAAENLAATLTAMQMRCQPGRCQINTGIRLTLDKLQYHDDMRSIELALIAFNTNRPVSATLDAGSNTVALAAPSSTLTLPSIRADGTLTALVSSINRLDLSQTLSSRGIDPAGLYAYAEVSVGDLYTNLVNVNLGSMQLDQRLTLQQGILHASGSLAHNSRPLLLNTLQHDFDDMAGRGTLEVPAIEFADNLKLSDLWSPLPWHADLLSGSASASARLNWQTGDRTVIVTGPVQLNLERLSGYVNEIAFLRLSTDFAAELLPDWQLRSTRTAPVHLDSLDAGIELTNIRSDVRVDATDDSITLTDTSLSVFGGTVSSQFIDYHLQDNDSRFTIVIDSIDLNRVLGMSAYRGVSATGLVSGQLPVRLQGLTPSISGGTLNALSPGGTIRYSSGTTASASGNASAGSQSLDLVYQALEHYRFNLMETQVDYQQSGELDLAIRMEGVSPELNGGQRINLNLNINDNIPALLQSLQAARSVTDSIQSRLDDAQE